MINPATITRLAAYLLCLSMPFLAALPSHAGDERKQVLYLNSYQNGYAWSDNILSGIRETLRDSGHTVDLQVEYMDAKKHPDTENRAILKQLFANKFASTHFDAIISSDNDAFQFLLASRDELFPGVPVVFCGVNDLRPKVLLEHANLTGVMERLDIRENLELALALSPEKRQLIVIGDTSLTSRAIEAQIKDVMPDFAGRLAFRFWNNIPLEQLLKQSRTLPEDSLLFFIPVYVETGGKYLSAGEVVQALYNNANVPIYGAWNFLLGHGIVGGKLLDGTSQGRAAAQMVVKILGGEPVSSIAPHAEAAAPLVFDWGVLDKFNLTNQPLPADALFINRPDTTYKLKKRVVWTVFILLFALTVFTVMMGASRNRAVRAEKELALSRKMLRSVIDTIPQLIYWKDLKSRYLGVNQQFANFFGLHAVDEVEGKASRDILKGEHFAETGERMDLEVMSDNKPRLRKVVTYDGSDHPNKVFEVSKVPLHDDNGNVVGVLSTAEDITVRVNLEHQLLQSQKMEAVGTFVGGIAHDFNNLLTTVINSTELALLDLDEGETAEDVLRAKNAAEQGSKLVSQILTYARPSNRDAMLVDPAQPVNEALHLINARLPETVRLERNVPNEMESGLIDPAQLQQIVMNLCTNSLHAMGKSGGTLTVSLATEFFDKAPPDQPDLSSGRYLRLVVHDTGPGIPQEAVDRIFDPFYTTKSKNEGTGLGLAIVQGIVQGHGGQIRLTSRPRHTAFDILLPFKAGDDVQPPMQKRPIRGSERILFVEDNPEQLKVIPRALTVLGYDVTPAPGGREALEILTNGTQFDMVVTDFDMPGLTGVELTRTVHQLFPDIPVILISGGREAASAAKEEPGIAQIVLKPYTGPSLAFAMRDILDSTDD